MRFQSPQVVNVDNMTTFLSVYSNEIVNYHYAIFGHADRLSF